MSMHIGAPAEPVVKKGDTVMVGTVIGKAGGFVWRWNAAAITAARAAPGSSS